MDRKIILIFSFLCFGFTALASNYYWVNGAGNWSDYSQHWATASGGTQFHSQIPTPTDDVYFDANSFNAATDTLLLDATLINCHSMNWNGTLPVYVYSPLSNTIELYGSLILSPGLKWEMNSGKIDFKSNSQDSIFTAGDSLFAYFEFSGTGVWNLKDDLHLRFNITQSNGSFNSNGHSINCLYFTSSNQTPRSLNINSSIINCLQWDVGDAFNSDPLILNAQLSIINCAIFFCGYNYVYNIVNATGHFGCDDSCTFNEVNCASFFSMMSTFHNVTLNSTDSTTFQSLNAVFHKVDISAPGLNLNGTSTIDSLKFSDGIIINMSMATVTVNSYLQLNGLCSNFAYVHSPDNGEFIKGSGIVNFNYVRFNNITFSGGATFNAINCIDDGSVTGINITPPLSKNFYWVNGTGQWNDPNHWSNSSGGAGDVCVPTKFDNVYFDLNSFPTSNDTVFCHGNFSCHSMHWNTINHPVYSCESGSQLQIEGSLVLDTSVTWDMSGFIYFNSDTSGNVINTLGKPLKHNVYISGTGEWDLQSDFNQVVNDIFYFKGGTFRSNGYTMHSGFIDIICNAASSFSLNSSLVYCIRWEVNPSVPINIDAINSRIECYSFITHTLESYNDVVTKILIFPSLNHFNDVTTAKLDGDNGVFRNIIITEDSIGGIPTPSIILGINNVANKITVISSSCELSGLNTTDTLLLLIPGQEITFDGVFSVNNYLQASGGCSGRIHLESTSNGGVFLSGSGILNDLFIHNFNLTGNAPLNAVNCFDEGGVVGITFTLPLSSRQLYWVNGSGKWTDTNHWSVTSGGPGGSCVPNILDDIYFDSLSFNSFSDTIIVDIAYMYAHSMKWSDSAKVFSWFPLINKKFELSGSVWFSAGVHWGLNDYTFELKSNQLNNEISISGADVKANWHLSGLGSWIIKSDMNNNFYNISAINLNTNGYTINASNFYCNNCNFDTSHISSNIFTGYQIDADSAHIYAIDFYSYTRSKYMNVNCTTFLSYDSSLFRNVSCKTMSGDQCFIDKANFVSGATNTLNCNNNTFGNASFAANTCNLSGINTFDTLSFTTLAQDVELNGLAVINNLFEVNTMPGFPTRIQSTSGGIISKLSDTVCIDNVYLNNISATGGAIFYAGNNSVDLGGNSGWLFSSCPLINIIEEPFGNSGIKLFPNPSPGNFTVELVNKNNETFIYSLKDLIGKEMQRGEMIGTKMNISRNELKSGIYILSVVSKSSKEQYFKKIILN